VLLKHVTAVIATTDISIMRGLPVDNEGQDRAASRAGLPSRLPLQNGSLPQALPLLQQAFAAIAHPP